MGRSLEFAVTSAQTNPAGHRGLPTKLLTQQSWGLSATALGAGAYGLLVWIVGAYVFSTWPGDGTEDITPIVDLAQVFTILNVLWGVALLVDLLNALWDKQRKKARIVGTLFAIGLVIMAQLAISNMRAAAGG